MQEKSIFAQAIHTDKKSRLTYRLTSISGSHFSPIFFSHFFSHFISSSIYRAISRLIARLSSVFAFIFASKSTPPPYII